MNNTASELGSRVEKGIVLPFRWNPLNIIPIRIDAIVIRVSDLDLNA
jgi:hypothetical protein